MADKCTMSITCRTQDAAAIIEALLDRACDRADISDGSTNLYFYEVAWAASVSDQDHGELPIGIPFYGSHGDSCGGFDPGEFATDGCVMRYEALSMSERHHLISFNTLTGEPFQEDLDRVKSYIAHWRKVYALVRGREFGPVNPQENP
jgi:hypothetical protein